MAKFNVVTRGDSDPHGKPRVYFTCHPDDFDKYFDKVCKDIFGVKEIDSAIYYTEDMSEPLDEKNVHIDLGRINLFLVPVTLKLLSDPCRAMQVDIAYAKEKNIPILPFIMETGLDSIYSLPCNFGERQYISPYSKDTTEISYKEKLEKHLSEVLLSNTMMEDIRKAFDTYVFLSYRKKDRAYANDLMKRIHEIPGCRDVAIWYDEFLALGESWRENIKNAMRMVSEKSNLFTIVITPNILEEYIDEEGKLRKNFVMEEEYPKAVDMQMSIFPAEMEDTNREQLGYKFDGIPAPVKIDDPVFANMLISAVGDLNPDPQRDTAKHSYLMGLAYRDGVDVEVNVERGVALITEAAEMGEEIAILDLTLMYLRGKKVKIDYNEAIKWVERLIEIYKKKYGEDSEQVIDHTANAAFIYNVLGKTGRAIRYIERVYHWRVKKYGKTDSRTISALNSLASYYGDNGKPKQAFKMQKEAYEISRDLYTDEHPETLLCLNNLGVAYSDIGSDDMAFACYEKAYRLRKKILGKTHPHTLVSYGNLASCYDDIGEHEKALEIHKEIYEIQLSTLGKRHPDSLWTLGNIASCYLNLEKFDLAIGYYRDAYITYCELFGPGHLDALNTLFAIAVTYLVAKDYPNMLSSFTESYEQHNKYLGPEHKNTLLSYAKIVHALFELKKYKEAYEMARDAYPQFEKRFGKNDETTRFIKDIRDVYKNIYDKK